jgi:hypothetical protein
MYARTYVLVRTTANTYPERATHAPGTQAGAYSTRYTVRPAERLLHASAGGRKATLTTDDKGSSFFGRSMFAKALTYQYAISVTDTTYVQQNLVHVTPLKLAGAQ